jgi:hypothetical protein
MRLVARFLVIAAAVASLLISAVTWVGDNVLGLKKD